MAGFWTELLAALARRPVQNREVEMAKSPKNPAGQGPGSGAGGSKGPGNQGTKGGTRPETDGGQKGPKKP